jgi:hypothetical protein
MTSHLILLLDSFNQLTYVVKAASAGCPGWVTILLGWKQEETSSDNIEM